MKILHLIYTNGISGAEKYLKHLLPGLQREGIRCELMIVCGLSAKGMMEIYKQELTDAGVHVQILISSRSAFLITAYKISKYCTERGIKYIHSHLINSDILAVLAKKIFNSKLEIVSTKHGYDERVLEVFEPGKPIDIKKNLYYRVTKLSIKYITKNLAVSKGISDLYVALQLCSANFTVIHHGVDIKAFDPNAYASECKVGNPQLIIVGRIETFKGHRYLIDAMPEIVKHYPSCVLVILGEGSIKDALAERVNNLGLQKNIYFMGFQSHPYSYISQSDIIVLPSLFEPFGLVYIEAFALRVPVVAFDTPAGNELMENNITAIMVPKSNSTELAAKIIALLGDDSERARLSNNAYNLYLEKFTTATMIKNTAAWYKTELI